MKLLIAILILAIPVTASAKRLHHEKEYQAKWCAEHGGEIEHVLDDNTRVDCLTDTHAIEFDFADKHSEAIGQALYYSAKTKRKPGIVLILEDPKDAKYLMRLNFTNKNKVLDIKVWTTGIEVKAECDIKGNINAKGEKIFHVPGQRFYNVTKISPGKGEQWFCSADKAIEAGWRASTR